ncbi:ribonuclease P protein component [Nocardioides sp. GY 10127]|uniref:ribonuclease P protein component n=1 Tax=Nocardioides sp. GY 10127 TaxID=2569762 RepID=UPI0010A808A4|nr:ribonuclease P protein component [Nocardioides sp. GY 10127]TIC82795.1 ribonuclease P protein component [Nocardioides sp. GY 10127]
MLPAPNRLTDSASFREAVRGGRRAGSRTVVVHLWCPDSPTVADEDPRVGFVVSKAVGVAVVRNRVKRRLRHLAREQLSLLPGRCTLVVRALPAAAGASSEELAADLGRCLSRVTA